MTWDEVCSKVGSDAVATLVWLYVDELAWEAGTSAEYIADPVCVFDALADKGSTIDPGVLNCAEARAVQRYKDDYQFQLEPLTDATWERYMELCREVVGVIG